MMKLLLVTVVLGLVFSKWVDGFVTVFPTKRSLPESSYGLSKATTSNSMVPLTLIEGARDKGAVCLDGTLPAYHLESGSGAGANSWLIHMEGGGWCENITSCVDRKKTPSGSSTFMEKQIQFTGILSSNVEENPDFFNWNRVYLRHCDGGSFTGDTENKEANLEFRGKRIWYAAMEDLKPKGMGSANQALLSGCSAGGLASMFYCDVFRNLFPTSTKVKCLSDAGFFADVPDVSGVQTFRKLLDNVVGVRELQNSLPPPCAINHLDPTSCFLSQNFIATIKTPLFLLNTGYDIYMIIVNLAPPSADPSGIWPDCEKDRSKCSPSQIEFLQGFRNQTLAAVEGFASLSNNGLFVNSCFAHCQSETQNTWLAKDSPVIGNKTISGAVGDWYFDRAPTKLVDCPYPCGTSCHNYPFLETLRAPNYRIK